MKERKDRGAAHLSSAHQGAGAKSKWIASGGIVAGSVAMLWLSQKFLANDHAFDEFLLFGFPAPFAGQSNLPAGIIDLARDVSALGSLEILAGLTAAVLGYLLLVRNYVYAVAVFLWTGGGAIVAVAIKQFFAVLKPHTTEHLNTSFPSGHAMLSAIVYLTFAVILSGALSERRLRMYLMLVAVLMTGAVGVSRVLIQVHWPGDVIAGWTIGAMWAALCFSIVRSATPSSSDTR